MCCDQDIPIDVSCGIDRDLTRLEKETSSLERPPIANITPKASNSSVLSRDRSRGCIRCLARVILLSLFPRRAFPLFLPSSCFFSTSSSHSSFLLSIVVHVAGGKCTGLWFLSMAANRKSPRNAEAHLLPGPMASIRIRDCILTSDDLNESFY